MVKKVGGKAVVSADHRQIAAADRLVLPGVGAFDHGMSELERLGLVLLLTEKVLHARTPILGICLGMQLFGRASEEGQLAGLGWINAQTVRFRGLQAAERGLRIPHMGWNHITPKKTHPVLDGLSGESRFYFVHSYHMECACPEDVLCTTDYGYEFTSAVAHGNIVGVQFHPEKSHGWGIQLLKNFARL